MVVATDADRGAAGMRRRLDRTAQEADVASAYMSEPGVVSRSPVSSSVFRPERIIGQPP